MRTHTIGLVDRWTQRGTMEERQSVSQPVDDQKSEESEKILKIEDTARMTVRQSQKESLSATMKEEEDQTELEIVLISLKGF